MIRLKEKQVAVGPRHTGEQMAGRSVTFYSRTRPYLKQKNHQEKLAR